MTTTTGIVMWLGIKEMWGHRADVIYNRDTPSPQKLMARIHASLDTWTCTPFSILPISIIHILQKKVSQWQSTGKCDSTKAPHTQLNNLISDSTQSRKQLRLDLVRDILDKQPSPDEVDVYTDGSTSKDYLGRDKSGIGIWYEDIDGLNMALPLPGTT